MGFKSPEDAATAASLSLLLEVSGNPKAGNVDREHDFDDLRYEHFLASAVSAFVPFLRTAENLHGIGAGIREAVSRGLKWHGAGNVHFGAFLLLMPLVAVWKAKSAEEAGSAATQVLKNTSVDDCLHVLEAFKLSGARVIRAERLALDDSVTASTLRKLNLSLYEWMSMAPEENLIAKELVEGYRISCRGAHFLLSSDLDCSESIVMLYHRLLAEHPDPLIIAKAGRDAAREVMLSARKALRSENPFESFKQLDHHLLSRQLNPGTIADLVASSIYLALLEGWEI